MDALYSQPTFNTTKCKQLSSTIYRLHNNSNHTNRFSIRLRIQEKMGILPHLHQLPIPNNNPRNRIPTRLPNNLRRRQRIHSNNSNILHTLPKRQRKRRIQITKQEQTQREKEQKTQEKPTPTTLLFINQKASSQIKNKLLKNKLLHR